MDLRIVRGGVQAVVLLLEAVLVHAHLPAAFLAESVAGFMRQRDQWPEASGISRFKAITSKKIISSPDMSIFLNKIA